LLETIGNSAIRAGALSSAVRNTRPTLKITVITVCFNAADTIGDTLRSVAAQDHPDVEHVVVDGGSSDGTQDVVKRDGGHVAAFLSEPDRGLYDAMNKGLRLATGDYIGFLHADDMFADEGALSRIAAAAKDNPAELILSDIEFVEKDDIGKRVRFYSAQGFRPEWLRQGDIPPQPGTYHRRDIYERYGDYDLSFQMSSDFDFFLRLFCLHKVSYAIVPATTVRMRVGGKSSQGLKSYLHINRDILGSARKNGIRITRFGLLRKYLRKISQWERWRFLRRASAGQS